MTDVDVWDRSKFVGALPSKIRGWVLLGVLLACFELPMSVTTPNGLGFGQSQLLVRLLPTGNRLFVCACVFVCVGRGCRSVAAAMIRSSYCEECEHDSAVPGT